jgi:hypothetical protein
MGKKPSRFSSGSAKSALAVNSLMGATQPDSANSPIQTTSISTMSNSCVPPVKSSTWRSRELS